MRLWSALVTATLLACTLGVVPVVAPAAGATAAASSAADGPCVGTVSEQPSSLTVVSVQGAKFDTNGSHKTPARVVAFHPNGSIAWVHHNTERYGISWSYDIDPLPNGNLFVTATRREDGEGKTLLYELNGETGEPVWSEQLDMLDTHDADMLNRTHVVIANMRNFNETTGENDDRLAIYNRTSGEIEWSWYFRDHYDRSVGGEYEDDWTHVNDVDKVGEHHFLASPRNFDQVVLVDRRTGEIDMKLGSDGDFDVMKKQHNPDYLESRDGTPTFLVADSENGRIVEYAHEDGEWNQTWSAGSKETLAWPRDADRLPNGNTLLADSRNDRVVEITPDGEVVWEVYAPYLVYDVERIPGDGSNGPTMADEGTGGHVDLSNASPPSEETLEPCANAIDDHEGGWSGDLKPSATASDGTAGTPSPTWGEGTAESDGVLTTDDDSDVFGNLNPLVAVAAIALVVAVLAVRGRRE